jgi:succinylglutamate desuccinylase
MMTRSNSQISDADVGAHVVAKIAGTRPGPLFIAVGGVHGNEPAGVQAAHRLAIALEDREGEIAGTIVLLAGNARALALGVRYVDTDLNRQWTPHLIEQAQAGIGHVPSSSENTELRELLEHLEGLLKGAKGEVYVVDLHTTSAGGAAFATMGDTLRNRRFASSFPVPIILGIEEQLDGTLLEYLNNRGCVTLGFEAGQHTDASSVDNHEAFLWLALVAAGNLQREQVPYHDACRDLLERAGGGARFVEVRYRHQIRFGDEFRMEPSLVSFQPIQKRQVLAHDWRGPVRAPESGMVLMPRYQNLGDDGFFIARDVKPFWMNLSVALRRARVGDFVHHLPGVRRLGDDPDTLIVNTYLARFFPLQIFHLLGFRKRRWSDGFLVVSRRRFDTQ